MLWKIRSPNIPKARVFEQQSRRIKIIFKIKATIYRNDVKAWFIIFLSLRIRV